MTHKCLDFFTCKSENSQKSQESSQDIEFQFNKEYNVSKLRPMLIGNHTYGNYNPARKTFWCTHGAWEGNVEFIDQATLKLFIEDPEIFKYRFIDKIPEDYNYT